MNISNKAAWLSAAKSLLIISICIMPKKKRCPKTTEVETPIENQRAVSGLKTIFEIVLVKKQKQAIAKKFSTVILKVMGRESRFFVSVNLQLVV